MTDPAWSSVGLEIDQDARIVYVARAGIVQLHVRAVVELLPPVAAEAAAGLVAALCRDHDVDRVVVDPDGPGVPTAELRALGIVPEPLSAGQRAEAQARFKMWSRSGKLKHRGHRDLTLAARAAQVRRSVSGAERLIRRDAQVDQAALLAPTWAVFGLPADLSGEGLGPDDVHVGFESSRRDPSVLPPHLAEQQRLIDLGITPPVPNWPGMR